MNRGAQLIALTVFVMVAGAVVIKGCGDASSSDPAASVENGAPRGLLALELLVAAHKADVVVRARFEDPAPPPAKGRAVFVIPPPETSSWTDADAAELLDRIKGGDRALILCDDDEDPRNHRLEPLLEAVGVECKRADVPIGEETLTRATGTMPRYAETLYVRGAGRVKDKPHASVFPAWTSGTDTVVMKRAIGAGVVTVLGSATIAANDGIVKADNAAFVLDELMLDELAADSAAHGVVVFDQRHHTSRSRAAFVTAANRGSGPLTALLALLLLVPLSLLSLAPRPGDPPRDDENGTGAPAAEAQARALAALLARRKR